MCGEQSPISMAFCVGMGSPPRVRGTGLVLIVAAAAVRITPACAGNSAIPTNQLIHSKDHPRVCGEQGFQAVLHLLTQGSPPRVRGTAI